MLKDLNYFPLDVESNIYSMTSLEFEDKTSKILVATSDCQIYCINYSKFKPQTREIEFTYIPSGAKIIAIGALRRGPDDFVIGITHSLAPNFQKAATSMVGEYNRLTTYYFNIYGSGSTSPTNFDLDYVAQGCQTLRLRYVPYHLYHTETIVAQDSDTDKRTVRRKPLWLLSGSDKCIHAFCEDRPYQSFNEIQLEECFPELLNVPGIALWIDVKYLEKTSACHERAIALGFEDGSVRLYHGVMNKKNNNYNRFELVRESQFDEFTTIIPCVKLFQIKSTASSHLREYLKSHKILRENQDEKQLTGINLLVVSSTEPSLVFENVLEDGLSRKSELIESQRLDCVTSAAIADTNVDGLNELLIGTHGKELLTYQYNTSLGTYELENVSILNYPLYAIAILDLTGDALKDVVILLKNGVIIMQSVIKDLRTLISSRVGELLKFV